MKIFLAYVILLLSTTLTRSQELPSIYHDGSPLCRAGRWEIVFQDDFLNNSLDTQKWYTYYPYGPNDSDQCQFCRSHDTIAFQQIFRDENVIVSDGLLLLKSDKLLNNWMGYESLFTAGMVMSKKKFNDYYKYEIRCQMPKGIGHIAAFWVFGWSTELDAFEWGGQYPNRLYMTIHKWHNYKSIFKSKKRRLKNLEKSFNVYSVEYEPNFVSFFFNGKLIHKESRLVTKKGKSIDGCMVPEGAYYLNPIFPNYRDEVQVIANSSIGNKTGFTKPPNHKTPFPQYFIIDYIRVYQKIADLP